MWAVRIRRKQTHQATNGSQSDDILGSDNQSEISTKNKWQGVESSSRGRQTANIKTEGNRCGINLDLTEEEERIKL